MVLPFPRRYRRVHTDMLTVWLPISDESIDEATSPCPFRESVLDVMALHFSMKPKVTAEHLNEIGTTEVRMQMVERVRNCDTTPNHATVSVPEGRMSVPLQANLG